MPLACVPYWGNKPLYFQINRSILFLRERTIFLFFFFFRYRINQVDQKNTAILDIYSEEDRDRFLYTEMVDCIKYHRLCIRLIYYFKS